MILVIIIAFISLISLLVLHEFGHFILAKKFGVPVEEFGVGYPPRLFGKKFRGTLYSLNLIPFGAFVKIHGEEGGIEDIQSFSKKPIWQRVLIILGGVLMFWLVAWVLLSIVMALGMPTAISDDENQGLINPRVQIIEVALNSPAQEAGIEPGDAIKQLSVISAKLSINKVKEVQEFIKEHEGKEIVLTIERGGKVFDVSLAPRISPPKGEGAMGVALVRTAMKSYPWYEAPIQGAIETCNLTYMAVQGWAMVISNLVKGDGMPPGAQVMGPIGIFDLFTKMSALGLSYFLRFVAIISIFLALFNILPIPALDGGKLVFLGIEAIRKKPVSIKIEQNITVFFFFLLILLMIFVTFKDIQRLF
jgi:regulator of sigma E protease